MQETQEEQKALWNGRAGEAWVEAQALLDRLFAPFAELLADAAAAANGPRVLDIGCGTGATTLAIANRLRASSTAAGVSCLGVDISEPMIAAARLRAQREAAAVRFVVADAETHAFEATSFDAVVSRFGVMFFGDTVRAFENLRRAAAARASLCFLAWRSAADNPFMTTAERAAAPLLPALPPRKAEGPGQFAFADQGRVAHMLEQAGWQDIAIERLDVPCTMTTTELMQYITRLGPLGLLLSDVDASTREQVVAAVGTAFEPFVHGAEVRFTAACWDIRARAPAKAA